MRGIKVVVCGFVLASVLVSLAALSANAQTAPSQEQHASEEPPQAERAVSSADGSPSQGSFTEGRAGPDEPSLVADTPPSDQEAAAARGRASGNAVVRAAKRYLGTRYGYGTCTRSRMSCTCLTKKSWARFGHKLSMSEGGQWKYGRARKVAKSSLRPGDIVFFKEAGPRRGITHVGLYSGRGNLVHASAYFGKVVESKMRYVKGYSGAKRLRPR
jgi:cell wall-associated NlpC family hydrolase